MLGQLKIHKKDNFRVQSLLLADLIRKSRSVVILLWIVKEVTVLSTILEAFEFWQPNHALKNCQSKMSQYYTHLQNTAANFSTDFKSKIRS